MDKKYFLNMYAEYDTAYLLEQRAKGEDLIEPAHAAIEQLLIERGVSFPPRPTKAIQIAENTKEKGDWLVKLIIGLVGFVLYLIAKALLKDSGIVGLLVGLLCGIAFFIEWIMSRRIPPEERRRREAKKRIGSGGFTELMFCAEEGDICRARDLINYGTSLDAKDGQGDTALMYAARDGQVAMVMLLLEHGADRHIRTPKGLSAFDYALKHGHAEVAQLLQE